MSVTIDPRLLLKPSQDLLEYVSSIDEDDLPEGLRRLDASSQLELGDVTWVFEHMRKNDDKQRHFHEVMSGCQMVLPEPKFPPRNPELEARVQKLRKEQEDREYKRMTQNVDRPVPGDVRLDPSISKQLKDLNSYLIVVFQFVLSVATAFAAGYLMPYYFYNMTDVGKRLLVGILFAFVVAVADLYFTLKFFLEEDGVISRSIRPIEKIKTH